MHGSSMIATALIYLQDRVREQIRKHRIPGASVAVLHDGAVHSAAAGYANIPAGVEADIDTVFDIGSITKVYTTTLMMMLVEEGLVAIDEPVGKYLPDLAIDHRPVREAVTIRTLLNHTSGIDGDFFAGAGSGDGALARFVDACADIPYLHDTGKFRAYSNTGFCIAGRVIEVVSGKPFNDLLVERILRPLGTEKFGFLANELMRYRRAAGHRWDTATQRFTLPRALRLDEASSPAGSILAMSAQDLLRFGRFHLDGGVTQSGQRLLGAARVAEMQAVHGEVPPSASLLRLGWTSPKAADTFLLSHGGRTIEQTSFLGVIPDHGFALAILTNSGEGASAIAYDLGAELVGDLCGLELKPPLSFAPADLKVDGADCSRLDAGRIVGRYRAAAGELEFSAVDGRLRGVLKFDDPAMPGKVNEDALTLVPLGGDKFAVVMDAPDRPRPICEFVAEGGAASPYSHLFAGGRVFVRPAGPAA